MLYDPKLLRIAHKLYQIYFEIYQEPQKVPTGVSINLETYRACLLFREQPILLPQECFIPADQLDF